MSKGIFFMFFSTTKTSLFLAEEIFLPFQRKIFPCAIFNVKKITSQHICTDQLTKLLYLSPFNLWLKEYNYLSLIISHFMHFLHSVRFLCILFFTATPTYSVSYALNSKKRSHKTKRISFHFKGLKSKIFHRKVPTVKYQSNRSNFRNSSFIFSEL